MNLDDPDLLKQLDPQNMLAEIDSLPAQLEAAWQTGQACADLPRGHIARVVVCGMGGSAIGGDLLAAHAAPACPVPIIVHRDYGLPAWAVGADTLVIACSHSGNTEETLDSFAAAQKAGCRLLAVCTGGELERSARAAGVPVWTFRHAGQPRAAVGYSFGLLLALLRRLGLLPDPAADLRAAAETMRSLQGGFAPQVPAAANPAKRLAGQLVGRWVNVYGAGLLAPVARRWKGQVNELAKAGAGFEILPEADHNALAGTENPEILSRTFTIFLQAPCDHPRNRRRLELTRQAFIKAGLNTEAFTAAGDTPLAHLWTTLHFGDYTAYYLALAYGMDPTPVHALQRLKAALK